MVFGVPTTKTAVRDVLCVITGKALPMCSSAEEDEAEATSEDAKEASSLQGADKRECRHNLEDFGLRIGLDCPQLQERTDTILNSLNYFGTFGNISEGIQADILVQPAGLHAIKKCFSSSVHRSKFHRKPSSALKLSNRSQSAIKSE